MQVRFIQNSATIKTWLSAIFPIINKNEDSEDPVLQLRHAAWRGDIEAVKKTGWLRDDLKRSVKDQLTALHLAVFNLHHETARVLLESSTHMTFNWILAERQSYSPLHLAASNNDCEMIQLLITAGADIHAISFPNKLKARAWAVEFRSREAYEILLKAAESHPNRTGSTTWKVLHWAAAYGDADTIKSLAEFGMDVELRTDDGYAPVHIAASNNNAETIKALYEVGASVTVISSKGHTPLQTCILNEAAEPIKVLLEAGVTVSALVREYGWKLARLTKSHQHTEIILALKSAGLDVVSVQNYRGHTPMHIAAAEGDVEMITGLVKCGAPVSAKGDNGWTPLHHAAARGHIGAINALFEAGADIIAKTDHGATATDIAELFRRKDASKVLKELAKPRPQLL
jgi:ankyrin repeat protein